MVLATDRGFFSYDLWRRALATSADLLWRIRTDRSAPKPERVEDLVDWSYLAHLRRSTQAAAPMLVRVINYTVNDGRTREAGEATPPAPHRVFTTMLAPEELSAAKPAEAYATRWELELDFDEPKTRQQGPRKVLQSKSPDLVKQEIWGHLCCHFAIRTLMADTPEHADRISFTTANRTVAHCDAFPLTIRDEHTSHGWPSSSISPDASYRPDGHARTPCVVKRKYTKWHVKTALPG